MNRKERRNAIKNGYDRKTIIDRTLTDRYEQGFHDGMKHSIDTILLMTAYTLGYKYGFGKKRLPEMMGYIANNIEAFATDHLNIRDLPAIREEVAKRGVIIK